MKVIVTAEDIEHGERKNCHLCPLALAIARALGHRRPGIVIVDHAMVYCGREWDWALLPIQALNFMIRFDNGRPVYPFAFELQLKSEVAA